jgi:DNA-binding SARP family transcriptional activator/tetratricopeptide (TPR) repeat protein
MPPIIFHASSRGHHGPTRGPCDHGPVTEPQPPEVLITLVGAPHWRSPVLSDAPLAPRDAALFALLALEGPLPRDRVASWLWPEVPRKNANISLRQRLFRLRQASGHALVEAGLTLRLLPTVAVDLLAVDVPEQGELLGGFDYGSTDTLDAWVLAARDRLDERRCDHWSGQAARLEARGELAAAMRLCERLIATRPLFEQAWRRLMRLHYLRGDTAAAVHVFERFEQQVCREHGLRPSAETLALLEVVQRAEAAVMPRHGPLPTVLLRPPCLIGRGAAMAAMARAWSAGRAVLVLGEGGMGKSRFLEALAQDRPGVLASGARPGDGSMPYATLTRLLGATLDRYAPALTPGDRDELARLLPALGTPLATPARQDRLWQAVATALQAASGNGLAVLQIDDLHWADAATLELLRWLLADPGLAGLRMAFAARPDESGPAAEALLGWLGDSLRIEPLRLGALDRTEVGQLIDSLGIEPADQSVQALAEALFRHAGGHPFFTLETLKCLLLGDGSIAVGPLPLPAAAAAMVQRRVQRLSGLARELLQLAALGGADLRLETVATVLRRPWSDLAAAWGELHAAQLVRDTGVAHDLVRDCVIAQLPAVAQSALHRALAEALDTQPGTAVHPLAEHWWQGQAWSRAAPALERAALQARHAGRLADSEALLERAAEAWHRAGEGDRRFELLAQALTNRMLRLGPTAALEGIAAWLPQAGRPPQRAALLVLRCQALLNLARYAEAEATAADALHLAVPGGGTHFDALTLHGRALALAGRVDEAMAALQRACASPLAASDPTKALHAQAALSHACYAAQRLDEAITAQRRAMALAERSGDAVEIAQTAGNLAALALRAGHNRLAYDSACSAAQRFESMGAVGLHRQINSLTMARCAAHFGQFGEALDLLPALCGADPGAAVPSTLQVLARVTLCSLLSWLGRPVDAAQALPADDLALAPLARALVLLARLQLRLGDSDAAPERQTLAALGQQVPSLLDDPLLLRDWSLYQDPREAAPRLLQSSARLRQGGAAGLANSLEVVAVSRLMLFDDAAAATLARRLRRTQPQGLHAVSYPPQAWWTLAQALRATGSAQARRDALRCRVNARRWIESAQLPDGGPEARRCFRHDNPINRAVLAVDGGLTGQ